MSNEEPEDSDEGCWDGRESNGGELDGWGRRRRGRVREGKEEGGEGEKGREGEGGVEC